MERGAAEAELPGKKTEDCALGPGVCGWRHGGRLRVGAGSLWEGPR